MDRSPPAVLQVCGLRRGYAGSRGAVDISFEVPAGALVALIGVNGSGKSTTLRSVLGLIRPEAGEIRLFGAPACPASRRRLGFVAEERGLNPSERAREAIAYTAMLHGVPRGEAFRRADHSLAALGLGARARARVRELSKGNAQRVQILAALTHDPDLLILDEPFSGLDPNAQRALCALLDGYRRKGGAVLFSTHSLSIAERLADRVVLVSEGRTLFDGATAEAVAVAPGGVRLVCASTAPVAAIVETLGGEGLAAPLDGERTCWTLMLPAGVSYAVLIRQLAEHKVEVEEFSPIGHDLEAAFDAMAGQAAA